MNEPKTFRHGMRYATSAAIDKLKLGKPGDTLDREAMAIAIKESCELGTPGYGSVNTAIKHCETNYQIVWRWDRDLKAYKCLNSSESVRIGGQLMRRARTKAKRSLRVASSVDEKKLTNEERRDHSLNVLSAGLMVTAGSSSFQKKVKNDASIGPNHDQLATLIEGISERGESKQDA